MISDGQVLYEAYAEHANWESINGEKLPPWDRLRPDIRGHWEHAAQALLRQQDGG